MACLSENGDSSHRSYLFSGADRLADSGWQLHSNLDKQPGTIAHHLGVWTSTFLHRHGGYGGDFPSCFTNLRAVKWADVIWSTVDTLGIPLSVLKKLRLLRKPLLYTSIGLPERLEQMPEGILKRWQIDALNHAAAMICYGWAEAEYLKIHFKIPVHFVPYGVDTTLWQPIEMPKTVDVLSLGIDPQRDFKQLIPFARKYPERSIRIITNEAHQAQLGTLPPNLTVDPPIPLDEIPQAMAKAKVIALPVKENTYSSATTTLLQAMSMALPVVVSEVGAISGGYEFKQHQSCLTVPPDDPGAFSAALSSLLSDPQASAAMGARARSHAVTSFDWKLYVDRMDRLLREQLDDHFYDDTP